MSQGPLSLASLPNDAQQLVQLSSAHLPRLPHKSLVAHSQIPFKLLWVVGFEIRGEGADRVRCNVDSGLTNKQCMRDVCHILHTARCVSHLAYFVCVSMQHVCVCNICVHLTC